MTIDSIQNYRIIKVYSSLNFNAIGQGCLQGLSWFKSGGKQGVKQRQSDFLVSSQSKHCKATIILGI